MISVKLDLRNGQTYHFKEGQWVDQSESAELSSAALTCRGLLN